PQPDAAPQSTAAAAEELRRLVASLRLARLHEPAEQAGQLVAKQLAAIASGAKTLDGIAKAGVELAQQFSQRGAAIVLHGVGPAAGTARVVAVSTAGDGRLAGLVLPSDAPVMRALQSAVPVVTRGAEDIFGSALPDRRRQDRAGTAYPVFDGHFVVGALVLTGPQLPPGTPVAAQAQRLLAELGARPAGAAAIRDKDLVARIGGEEFAVWMPHTPLESGLEVAERIRRSVEGTVWRWDGQPYALALSCGVAGYPDSVRDITNLRSAADAALYRAKQGGRNRVEKAVAAG